MLARIILMIMAHEGMDPTETAVIWKALSAEGYAVVFATPDGKVAAADPRMLDGTDLGAFKYVMRADQTAAEAYKEMTRDHYFRQPMSYAALADYKLSTFDGLVLPGGHDVPMRRYMESPEVQQMVAAFFDADKPVAAICHGVTVAARSVSKKTGKSVLYGRRTTSLTRGYELLPWALTRAWLGNYFRTYAWTVEEEVRSALSDDSAYESGSFTLVRDSSEHPERGFAVRDGHYVSARWPGDAHRFATEFLQVLRETRAAKNGIRVGQAGH